MINEVKDTPRSSVESTVNEQWAFSLTQNGLTVSEGRGTWRQSWTFGQSHHLESTKDTSEQIVFQILLSAVDWNTTKKYKVLFESDTRLLKNCLKKSITNCISDEIQLLKTAETPAAKLKTFVHRDKTKTNYFSSCSEWYCLQWKALWNLLDQTDSRWPWTALASLWLQLCNLCYPLNMQHLLLTDHCTSIRGGSKCHCIPMYSSRHWFVLSPFRIYSKNRNVLKCPLKTSRLTDGLPLKKRLFVECVTERCL